MNSIELCPPGRDSEPQDYEAHSALRTLLEAEAIRTCGDEEFLGRISDELERQMGAMDRVSEFLSGVLSGEEDGEGESVTLVGGTDRADSRTIGDFLARINKKRKDEYRKNLMPLRG